MAFTILSFRLSILGKILTRKTELPFFTKESKQYLFFLETAPSKKKVSNFASFNSESILFLMFSIVKLLIVKNKKNNKKLFFLSLSRVLENGTLTYLIINFFIKRLFI